DPLSAAQRRQRAFDLRVAAAQRAALIPLPLHPTNGEEEQYPTRIASFSKALPHNDLGEVDPPAYNALLRALRTGSPADFARIPLGGAVKLTSPQSALAFDLLGPDS